MTKILVVDDQLENLDLLRLLLEGHGWEMMEATHGGEALALAREERPDLIVSDLLMPNMDGYTLLRQWRSDPDLQGIPFVVFTATYTDAEDEHLAMSLGADAFLLKPAPSQTLLATLEGALRQRELSGPQVPRPEPEETVVLREYNEVLVRKLEEKLIQLERANQSLRESLEARDRLEAERQTLDRKLNQIRNQESLGGLAAGMAHDFRNILAPILGMAATMREQILPEEARNRALDAILAAAHRGDDAVQRLLRFARKELPSHGPVDLNALLEEVLGLVQVSGGRLVRFETDLQPLPVLAGHAGDLTHALMNLCLNAVEAMPEGGTLTASSRPTAEGGASLELRDTGQGMPPEVLARVLDPYFTTKPEGQGTGLGLSTAAAVVRSHGGTLDLRSEVGRGTTVTLTFPAPAGARPSER